MPDPAIKSYDVVKKANSAAKSVSSKSSEKEDGVEIAQNIQHPSPSKSLGLEAFSNITGMKSE